MLNIIIIIIIIILILLSIFVIYKLKGSSYRLGYDLGDENLNTNLINDSHPDMNNNIKSMKKFDNIHK